MKYTEDEISAMEWEIWELSHAADPVTRKRFLDTFDELLCARAGGIHHAKAD